MTNESLIRIQFKGYIQRGQIISQFAYVENLIKIYIVCSFFKDREKPLAIRLNSEILDDKNFHFSTLKSIFETILSKSQLKSFKEYESNISGKLRGMYDIRCVIAHSIEKVNYKNNGQSIEFGESVVKWSKKGHPPDETIKSVHDKFFKHNGEVSSFLENLIKAEQSKK